MFTRWSEHSINHLSPMKFWDKNTTIPVTIKKGNRVNKYNCRFYSFGRLAHLYYDAKKYDAHIIVDFSGLQD